ncbi:MAG: hypothetical protein EOP89_11520 [Lysobacteraceae bacterium]|nr:MAG: hypothetical protein EOP89_11520 [Xanthomonadaceae bacterium]
MTNSAFVSSNNQQEFNSVEDAYKAALQSGLEIACDEINRGATTAIVELAVDLVGQRYAARGALAISTARLVNGEATVSVD